MKQLVTVLLDLADETMRSNWVDWQVLRKFIGILGTVELFNISLKTVSFDFATQQVENFEHYERHCWI